MKMEHLGGAGRQGEKGRTKLRPTQDLTMQVGSFPPAANRQQSPSHRVSLSLLAFVLGPCPSVGASILFLLHPSP